jgi:hypothetical protein
MTISFETFLRVLDAGGTTALIVGLVILLQKFLKGEVHSDASLKRELLAKDTATDQLIAAMAAEIKSQKDRGDRLEALAFRVTELGERIGREATKLITHGRTSGDAGSL